MFKTGFTIWTSLLLFFLPFQSNAQDLNLILNEAKQLETLFKDQEALDKYVEILRYQPTHLAALIKASELHSRLGKRLTAKDKQKQYYNLAKSYAVKALQVNANSSDANFVMAVAIGRVAQIASNEEKIKGVKDIKLYAEKSIKLDPNSFKGYHVLGKWHFEVSNLSAFEKWLVKVAFGSLPASSLDEAIRNYEKSKQLYPAFLLNYLELAKSYHRKDKDAKAIELLEALLKLPDIISDDAKIRREAQELLKDYR